MSTIETILSALGGGATFIAIFIFTVQRIADRFLQDHFDQKLEHYKLQLNTQATAKADILKAQLQLDTNTALEHAKSELNTKNDQLRHELDKQIIRAQLATGAIHEEFLRIAKEIRIAQGKYLGLIGLSRAQTFEGFSKSDIVKVLREAKTPRLEARSAIQKFVANREAGINQVKEILRRKQLHDADASCNEARNTVVINRMLLGRGLYKKAMDVIAQIQGAITDIELLSGIHLGPEEAARRLEKPNLIDSAIELLEDEMSTRILPNEVKPTGPTLPQEERKDVQPSTG
ncbi:hypothetical protein [Corallococcus sp. RDP092CA]|uniref:hypothetical protein n=1 Tax=Corallococcus sp. RDP092CA TaxID=3109369 RepID=UPI0035B02F17